MLVAQVMGVGGLWAVSLLAADRVDRYGETVPAVIPRAPRHLDDMLTAARRLGAGLDFVRIDMYDTDEGVVLGAMTCTARRWPRNADDLPPVQPLARSAVANDSAPRIPLCCAQPPRQA
jgi:hypothetical protein